MFIFPEIYILLIIFLYLIFYMATFYRLQNVISFFECVLMALYIMLSSFKLKDK